MIFIPVSIRSKRVNIVPSPSSGMVGEGGVCLKTEADISPLECIRGILTLRASSSLPGRLCPDSAYACILVFELLTITRSGANTTCNFEGGATKPIVAEITAQRTAWTCIRYRKRRSMIMLIVFVEYYVLKHLSDPA